MRLRQPQDSGIPEVNLVPMMDVLMSVLTFFVISTITMTGERIEGVDIPRTGEGGTGTQPIPTEVERFVVGLNKDKQLVINNKAVEQPEMIQQMQTFLQDNPEGLVLLSAHRSLEYAQIEGVLKTMGAIGGERVSLVISRQ
ncbi:MAG: biopolymer transporter ExbD [Spirulina sp. SIO3F2]|nr:biopolymer transporter ExbD [Spirulina sp. SIO3F2]